MRKVSEGGEELFIQLVEWEMLGRSDVCPKALLRSVSLADLSIASRGLDQRGGLGEFVTSQMVEMELLYRTGKLHDWEYARDGDKVRITAETKKTAKRFNLEVQTEALA